MSHVRVVATGSTDDAKKHYSANIGVGIISDNLPSCPLCNYAINTPPLPPKKKQKNKHSNYSGPCSAPECTSLVKPKLNAGPLEKPSGQVWILFMACPPNASK